MVSGAVTLITLLAEVLMVLLCLHTAFGKKFKFDWATVGIVLVDIVLFMLVNLRYIPQVWMATVYILLGLYCFGKFKLSVGKTVVCYVIGLAIAGVLEGTIQYVIYKSKVINSVDISSLISCFASIACATVVYKIFYNRVKTLRVNKSIMVITVMYGLVFGAIVVEYHHYNTSKINLYFVVMLIFLLGGYVYLYKLNQAQSIIEKKTLENELQKIYGSAYQELLDEVRRKQHDFKNQIGAILSMHVVSNSMDELIRMQREYADELLKDNKFNDILLSCNNPILAGYMYTRFSACVQREINVIYKIKVDWANCAWGIHEIIEILGILLDNACEHVMIQDIIERKIRVSFVEEEQQIMFSVANPAKQMSNGEINKLFAKGYSTKGDNRGIGLARILELVKKYDSLIEVKNIMIDNRNWIEFKIKILK